MWKICHSEFSLHCFKRFTFVATVKLKVTGPNIDGLKDVLKFERQ